MLLYPIGRAGKTKEVDKAHMDPVAGLFDRKPILRPICMRASAGAPENKL
jgi:hypothetical protein